MATTNSVFKAFEQDDIVLANSSEVTTGLWTGDTGSLSAFYTSSFQVLGSSGQYYVDVYNINPTSSLAEVQFSVAYGNRTGGGAPTLVQDSAATLSSTAIYAQYRNMVLEPGDAKFTFGVYDSDQIMVVNIARARIRETLDPGNFVITLSGVSGKFTFIDNSNLSLSNGSKAGSVYTIVSGSLTGPSGSTIAPNAAATTKGAYGLVYPDIGVLIFNVDALIEMGVFPTGLVSGSTAVPVYNQLVFVNALNASGSFVARFAENISSTQLYVRLRNKEFNYSNNPSFYDTTNGSILNAAFVQNPIVYVTTVGLYNDNNELIAVAKLSKPLKKSFSEESLIRIRIDW